MAIACCSKARAAMKRASYAKAKKAADEARKNGGKHTHMQAKKAPKPKKATSPPAKPCKLCGKVK